MNLIRVDRQPVIPPQVRDCTVGREWHRYGKYWVFFIRSDNDGPREWASRFADAPPGVMIPPDGVEYYREICPFGSETEVPDLVRGHDGVWYWQIEKPIGNPGALKILREKEHF